MKPLRIRLQEAREKFEVPWDVLERDYLLHGFLRVSQKLEYCAIHLSLREERR